MSVKMHADSTSGDAYSYSGTLNGGSSVIIKTPSKSKKCYVDKKFAYQAEDGVIIYATICDDIDSNDAIWTVISNGENVEYLATGIKLYNPSGSPKKYAVRYAFI